MKTRNKEDKEVWFTIGEVVVTKVTYRFNLKCKSLSKDNLICEKNNIFIKLQSDFQV